MAEPCRVCASTAVVRAEAKPTVDPADFPPIDEGMWLRLATAWDVAYLHRVLASYRVHDATHSATYGEVSGPGYTFARSLIEDVHRVKLRFLDGHGASLSNRASLRQAA